MALPNPYIALVDDDALVRGALGRLLRLADFEVTTFPSGEAFVATLVEEEQGPGEYSVGFGPGAGGHRGTLPAGIYFCRLRAGAFGATQRMVRMR